MVSKLQQQQPAASEADGATLQMQMQERAAVPLTAGNAVVLTPALPGALRELRGEMDAVGEQLQQQPLMLTGRKRPDELQEQAGEDGAAGSSPAAKTQFVGTAAEGGGWHVARNRRSA
eukprot:4934588-Prymnesium_polylepis.1